MSATESVPNGMVQHWLVGQDEPSGQFTAQVVGVPELRATATNREEAIQKIRAMLTDWLAQGRLMSIEVPVKNPLLNFSGHLNANDPLEQEFQKELARLAQEDLVNTLREDDQECCSFSSTPTT